MKECRQRRRPVGIEGNRGNVTGAGNTDPGKRCQPKAGQDIAQLHDEDQACGGLGFLPQGHSTFDTMSLLDNLCTGCVGGWDCTRPTLNLACSCFAFLTQRGRRAADTLSGDRPEMLVIARVLIVDLMRNIAQCAYVLNPGRFVTTLGGEAHRDSELLGEHLTI